MHSLDMWKSLVFLAALLSFPAYSARHELVFGPSPALLGDTGGQATFNQGTTLSGALAYHFTMTPQIQFGMNFAIAHVSGGFGTGSTAFQILAGPTLNFPGLYDSFFVSGMFGAVDGGTTDLALTGELGYRLRMVEHVTWRPSAGLYKVLDGSSVLIVIRPFAFSVIL